MPPESPSDDRAHAATPPCRWSPRAVFGAAMQWAKANRFKTALLAASFATSILAAIGLWFLVGKPAAPSKSALPEALEALDKGEWSEARGLAESLRRQKDCAPEDLGGAAFILGAAAAYEADQASTADRKELYLLASRYLEEARDRGFPAGREAEGLLLLGWSLYYSNQVAASRPVLRDALQLNPEARIEVHYLLAEACMNDAEPQHSQALEENARYLADRTLTPGESQRGLLQRARILLNLERIPECLQTLSKIPADAKDRAEATVLQGQVLLHQARQVGKGADRADAAAVRKADLERREKLDAAISTLRRAESDATASTDAGRKAVYLIGVCFQELKDYRAALNQFARVRKATPDTPEALAAAFQAAEIVRQSGNDKDALAGYRQVLVGVGVPETYVNPWVSLAELRRRLLAAYREYLTAEKFDVCSQLIRHLCPLFSNKQQLELAAQTYRDWGRSMLAQTAVLPPSQSRPMAAAGREKLRHAGREFERLSRLRIADREFPDDLWEAAEAYLAGHAFRDSARLFQDYLKHESRRRHPRALVGLAEAMLSLGRFEEAIAACKQCTEFHPRDAAAFSARLLAAVAQLEKGDVQLAKQLLLENLNGEYLTPASKEWRDSLFDLGRLFHREGAYAEAIERLQEAVRRYPDSPRTLEAEYLIADSCRLTAKRLEEKLDQDRAENVRAARSKKVQEMLGAALDGYQAIQERLARRQETDELTDLEKLTLRNCYFSSGQMLFELGRYEEAIKTYVMVTNRYQNSPEVLDAYVQIARAYQRLDKPAESRSTLEQAKMVLARMKPEVPFEATTNGSRDQWAALLERLTAT
ncbi:MAG: tetratricopeptide repeat protein [Pirellulales bacterium]|nr:tetratricopeptide repeat protein [Pirellulales bacterium]